MSLGTLGLAQWLNSCAPVVGPCAEVEPELLLSVGATARVSLGRFVAGPSFPMGTGSPGKA
eukprot:4063258-Prorocentrum_lima.AAC.1